MNEKTTSGSCLCGSVTYQYVGPGDIFQYCHCSRCQKSTGSAHASNIIIDPSRFNWIDGEQWLGRYEVPEAKHFATAFCKKCGSSLPWLTKSGKAMVIPAGTLDDDPEQRPMHNIFIANRAPWCVEVGAIKTYKELPD